MPHGNAVVDGDGVELRRKAALRLDEFLDLLPYFVQVHVAGHELGERIDNGDYRPAELVLFHAVRPPQAPGARHSPALGGCRTAQFYLHLILLHEISERAHIRKIVDKKQVFKIIVIRLIQYHFGGGNLKLKKKSGRPAETGGSPGQSEGDTSPNKIFYDNY
jgi:hypothetical protein